ncbi:hypothetical protein ABZ297_18215 [Nonomuraea sp. NPDC005983]|uniref:hypothetical protein n=1 Tax=Nonomuraea sp. NPDC005983 TaxID=3155595 RepID=UPI0033A90EA1
MTVTPYRLKPSPAEPGTATRRLSEELKPVCRRVGEPSMRKLERAFLRRSIDGAVSVASISKALSGSTGRTPPGSW